MKKSKLDLVCRNADERAVWIAAFANRMYGGGTCESFVPGFAARHARNAVKAFRGLTKKEITNSQDDEDE